MALIPEINYFCFVGYRSKLRGNRKIFCGVFGIIFDIVVNGNMSCVVCKIFEFVIISLVISSRIFGFNNNIINTTEIYMVTLG